jgi:hypothetical protein
VVAAVLLWAGVAYALSSPPGPDDYRRALKQVAAATHDSARTGWLTGRQQLAGQVVAPFAATAFDDATKGLAGATRRFAQEQPPDEPSRRLRDELGPLVAAVGRSLADAAQADSDPALQGAVDTLGALADQLEHFIEELR